MYMYVCMCIYIYIYIYVYTHNTVRQAGVVTLPGAVEQLSPRVPVDLLAGPVVPDRARDLVVEHVYADAAEPRADVVLTHVLRPREPEVHPHGVGEVVDHGAVPPEDVGVAHPSQVVVVLLEKGADDDGVVCDEVHVDVRIPREQLRLAAPENVQDARRHRHDDVRLRREREPPQA